jgi:hypothetical protein
VAAAAEGGGGDETKEFLQPKLMWPLSKVAAKDRGRAVVRETAVNAADTRAARRVMVANVNVETFMEDEDAVIDMTKDGLYSR